MMKKNMQVLLLFLLPSIMYAAEDSTQSRKLSSFEVLKYFAQKSGGMQFGEKAYDLSMPALSDGNKHRESWVRALAWNASGTLLAAALLDRRICIVDPKKEKNFKILGALANDKKLVGHTLPANAVTWSPCSKFLASGGHDKAVYIWDLAAEKPCNIYTDLSYRVKSVDWNSKAPFVAVAAEDTTIRILHAFQRKEVKKFGVAGNRDYEKGHNYPALTVKWNPQGTQLVSGSEDATVRIWDFASGKQLCILGGTPQPSWHANEDAVTSVVWNNREVISGSDDGTISFWDPQLSWHAHGDSVTSVVWNNREIISGSDDGIIRFWNPKEKRLIDGYHLRRDYLGEYPGIIDLSSNVQGQYIVTAFDDGRVFTVDRNNKKLVRIDEYKDDFIFSIFSVAQQPKGYNFVVGTAKNIIVMHSLIDSFQKKLSLEQKNFLHGIYLEVQAIEASEADEKVVLNQEQSTVYQTLPEAIQNLVKPSIIFPVEMLCASHCYHEELHAPKRMRVEVGEKKE